VVNAPTITLSPVPLPSATAESLYTQNLSASGGLGPYTFSVTSGPLPSWLTLSTAGKLSGTPPTTSPVTFTAEATDSEGFTGSQSYTLSVVAPTITVSPSPPLANATWESPYTPVTFSATGGAGPYTFTVPPNSLPTGLSLNPTTGVLSGTPTAKSQIGTTFTFVVTATDSGSFTGTRQYSIKVVSPCGAGLTPYFLSATAHTGNFTGLFCVNGSGSGTYLQSGGAHGTGTVTTSAGTTRITAFGTDLALVGDVNAWSSTFTETAPAPEKAGTFTLV
jgi:hypothetical protein